MLLKATMRASLNTGAMNTMSLFMRDRAVRALSRVSKIAGSPSRRVNARKSNR